MCISVFEIWATLNQFSEVLKLYMFEEFGEITVKIKNNKLSNIKNVIQIFVLYIGLNFRT